MITGGWFDAIVFAAAAVSGWIGWKRGFCEEAIRFVIYVLSGIAGYFLMPLFVPPIAAFVEKIQAQYVLALSAGSFFVWFFLRLLTEDWAKKVKKSRLAKIDAAGGVLAGMLRAVCFAAVLTLVCAVASPAAVENGFAARTLYPAVRGVVYALSGIEMAKEVKADPKLKDWKRTALRFMKETRADGRPVLDYVCAYAAGQFESETGQTVSARDFCDAFQMQMEGKSQREIVEIQTERQIQKLLKNDFERKVWEDLKRKNHENTGG